MPLPPSGAISLNEVNVELGNPGTSQIGMNDAAVRGLFQVPSGAISMSDGYGKSSQFEFTISSPTTNADLQTLATNAGWNGSSKVVATISPGVYISATSTGTAALTVPSSFPGTVELTNNGVIVGRGGSGGGGGNGTPGASNPGSPGGSGGKALNVLGAITITNNGTIAGGGGGGGGGGASHQYAARYDPKYGSTSFVRLTGAGGGGGGGRSSNTPAPGGSAGNVPPGYSLAWNRANPGGAGNINAYGNGGNIITYGSFTPRGGVGGRGGNWGASGVGGSSGNYAPYPGGPGFYAFRPGGSAGGAGAAITGNPYITWAATGTRTGPIS